MDLLIISKAVKRVTNSDISKLEGIIADTEKILSKKPIDWEGFLLLDRESHLTFAQILGNPIYEWLLETVIDNFFKFYDKFKGHKVSFTKDSLQTLIKIVEALKEKNAEAALAATEEHIHAGIRHIELSGDINKAIYNVN